MTGPRPEPTDSRTIRVVATDLDRREGRKVTLPAQNLDWAGPALIALTGSNGSGKSTLLRTIAGLTVPSSGSVAVDGDPPTKRKVMAATAYVPDAPVTFLDTTVEDQCRYVARLHGLDEAPPWIDELADCLGFGPDLMARMPVAFSKGERQKASVLLHLSRPHRLVIMDEPTTGFDADARANLADWLVRHTEQQQVLAVVATHDEELTAAATSVHRLADPTP